jgi:gliding motility-associated-like protein
LWSNGAGDTSTVIVSPTISTNYFITITDACGAIVTDSVMVNFATTNAVIGNDTTICSGGTATLTAGGGIAYHWSNNVNSNINPVSPLQTTVYYVTVTDACKGYDSITVNVNPPPTIITSASPDSICVGGSSTLNATGGVSYVWSSNPVDSGLIGQQTLSDPVVHPTITTIYTVIGTDNLTCTNTSSVVVVIKPTPIASFTINPQEACVGQTVTLLYNGTVGSKISYNWDFGGGFLVGPNYQFYWDSTGKKIITLSIIVDGCPSTTFIDSVLIDPLPVAGFTATDTAGCAPLTVSFIDSSKYESASTIYLWNFGDGSTSTEQDPIHGYNNAGTYNVTLTISNGAGCTDSLTLLKFVHVYPAPVAAFAANPYTVSIFDPAVMFFNKSTGYPPPVSWLWNMGDGGISADSSNFIYTYRDTGKFEVSLIAYNKYGCSDTTFANITVRSDYSIYIPNAFTPNGDALNPVFYAYGTGITVFDMKIFDRWGELLFESNDIYAGWDGKYKGAPCPEGVYTYQIYYIEDQKEEHLLFGRITLIR